MLAHPLRPSSSMTLSTLSFRSARVIREGRRRAAEKWRFSRTESVPITTSSCQQYWTARRNTTDSLLNPPESGKVCGVCTCGTKILPMQLSLLHTSHTFVENIHPNVQKKIQTIRWQWLPAQHIQQHTCSLGVFSSHWWAQYHSDLTCPCGQQECPAAYEWRKEGGEREEGRGERGKGRGERGEGRGERGEGRYTHFLT